MISLALHVADCAVCGEPSFGHVPVICSGGVCEASWPGSPAEVRARVLASRLYNFADAVRCIARILMLPYPYAAPACGNKPLVGVLIPATVRLDLLGPEGGVGGGDGVVCGAPMPEAAIEEHRHPGSGEYEVGAAPDPAQRARRDAVAQAEGVYRGSKRELGLRVSTAVRSHTRPDARRRRPRLLSHEPSLRTACRRGSVGRSA